MFLFVARIAHKQYNLLSVHSHQQHGAASMAGERLTSARPHSPCWEKTHQVGANCPVTNCTSKSKPQPAVEQWFTRVALLILSCSFSLLETISKSIELQWASHADVDGEWSGISEYFSKTLHIPPPSIVANSVRWISQAHDKIHTLQVWEKSTKIVT